MLVASVLLGSSYAWSVRRARALDADAVDTVRIAATAYIGACPILMAQANGYFASEGVAAAIHVEPSGKAALEGALHGRADLATVADVPIMFAAVNGEPVSVVATIATAEKDHGIVGRRDRGIALPASLKGKRIGVPLGTSAHFFLDAFLNRQTLSPTDVSLVSVPPEELAGALARGDVDAVAVWQPFLSSSLAALGSAGVVFHGEAVYDVVYALAGTRDYVTGHSRAVQKVLRAAIRGARFCNETPDLAREHLAKLAPAGAITFKELWPSYRFEVALRQGLLIALEDETRWAMKNELTAETDLPNYLNNVDLEPLRVVAPAAVTVVH